MLLLSDSLLSNLHHAPPHNSHISQALFIEGSFYITLPTYEVFMAKKYVILKFYPTFTNTIKTIVTCAI